jgi:lysophospholipase L1-like esterase
MQRTTAAFGGRLVVMFLPFKSQAYWPLLERALPRATVDAALHFYLDGNGRPIDIDAMRRNRLAQNRMMRELCERLQIPFLDTTAALQARLESGENVYFPDESHLNETGEAVVADTLAAFLRTTGIVTSSR